MVPGASFPLDWTAPMIIAIAAEAGRRPSGPCARCGSVGLTPVNGTVSTCWASSLSDSIGLPWAMLIRKRKDIMVNLTDIIRALEGNERGIVVKTTEIKTIVVARKKGVVFFVYELFSYCPVKAG
jgi:hypothetical protein